MRVRHIAYVPPEQLRRGMDPVWAFWQIGFSPNNVERYKDHLVKEMLKQSTTRDFPYTSYWIIAYGQKPAA